MLPGILAMTFRLHQQVEGSRRATVRLVTKDSIREKQITYQTANNEQTMTITNLYTLVLNDIVSVDQVIPSSHDSRSLLTVFTIDRNILSQSH